MRNDKLNYFLTSLWKRVRGVDCACPNCGSARYSVEDRKYVVTELCRCLECRLMYRAPSDSPMDNEKFYQESYAEAFVTDIPTDEEFERHLANGFKTPHHDYGYFISILSALGLKKGSRLFDYGCSWGYGSWQLGQAGFDVLAYEISRPRADFARKRLAIDVVKSLPDPKAAGALASSFDCFFSSHVIEHVPKPAEVVALARALLKPGGCFVAITPNGSRPFRDANRSAWHQLWGKVHPNLIDDQFWRACLTSNVVLGSSPIDPRVIGRFCSSDLDAGDIAIDGGELVCVALF